MDGNDDFGEGYDYLSGGDGSDEIHGGVGHDWLLGGDAHDSLHGKEGDDAIWAVSLSGDRDGSDYLNGGADTNHCAWDSTDTEQFCHPFN